MKQCANGRKNQLSDELANVAELGSQPVNVTSLLPISGNSPKSESGSSNPSELGSSPGDRRNEGRLSGLKIHCNLRIICGLNRNSLIDYSESNQDFLFDFLKKII